MLVTYTKPNGKKIEVSDNFQSNKYAESLGWKKAGSTPAKKDDAKAVKELEAKQALEAMYAMAKDAGIFDSINWKIKGARKIEHVKADFEKALNDSQDTNN